MEIKNNVECLIKIAENFLSEKKTINSKQEWEDLLDYLYKHKLIQLEDTKIIDAAILIFPLTIDHFLRIITQSFSDEKIRNFETSIIKFMDQINEMKSTLQFWNTQGMDNQELQSLLIILEKIRKEIRIIIEEFQELNDDLQNNRENVLQMKDNFQHLQTEIITSFDYQKNDGFMIEKEFAQIRVRDVQYRNQPIKVIKNYANGIIKQIGYCNDNDFALEIIKIPKNFPEIEFYETFLYTFDALKELTFSKFFQNYFGCNQTTDLYYNQYFLELIKGKSLKKLLQTAKFDLHPNMSLFRLWMREIFLGLKDILEKTIFVPIQPIGVKNILISDNGLKIYFKNVKFSGIRRTKQNSHESLEAQLLKSYANLLLELLGKDESQITSLEKYLDFQNFIIGLLDCDSDLEKYRKDKSSRRLTFENLLEHHLLSEHYLIEADVVEMVEQYDEIFNTN